MLPAVPSETFTHRSTTNASVERVWAALDRPETWEAIGGVDRVFDPQIDDHGRLRGFSFETVAGGKRYIGVAHPLQRVEGEVMAWKIANSEVTGVTSVALAAERDKIGISVTLHVESTGFLSSMFFPIIAGAIGRGLPAAVDGFAIALEA